MNGWVIPKVIAMVPLCAFFAFARIDMANAYYQDLKAAPDQAMLGPTIGSGQVFS